MKLESKTIRLRLVNEDDADFILKLRLDERYNQFLSAVTPDLNAQREWIRKYKEDESCGVQYYFIIEKLNGGRCGTVRVYDLREQSFCWGSWILNEDKSKYSAVESAFLVYKFGFEVLGYSKSHFDVMKGNDKVVSFHKRMGAIQTGEDEKNYYYEINQKAVQAAMERLKGKLI